MADSLKVHPCVGERFTVVRNYEPKPQSGYLPLAIGQEAIIRHVGQGDELDWCYGEVCGSAGWFPNSCIAQVDFQGHVQEHVRAACAALCNLDDDELRTLVLEEYHRRKLQKPSTMTVLTSHCTKCSGLSEQLSDSALLGERLPQNKPFEPVRNTPLQKGESTLQPCQASPNLDSKSNDQTKDVVHASVKKERIPRSRAATSSVLSSEVVSSVAARQSAVTWTISDDLLNEIRGSVRANGGKVALKRLSSRYPGIDRNSFLLDFVYKYENDCMSSKQHLADALGPGWCTVDI